MFAATGAFVERHLVEVSIGSGVIVALLLRAPWHDAPLGRDEGGDAMVARAWHGGGPFAYGSYFLDRPPLLLALYRLAGDTPAGIRSLGAVAAVLLVVTSTLLAVRLGGRRAAPWAAAISAVLASSSAIKSVFTPAELLAVVPSSASVLLLLIAVERRAPRFRILAAAGALAAVALLVKQSFGDALLAGGVALLAGRAFGVSWRETARRAGAYLAGIGAVAAGLALWAVLSHTSAHSVWYAMFGFRIDSAHVLAQSVGLHIGALVGPLRSSGLAVALALAVVALARSRRRPLVRVTYFAWIAAAIAGILLGGSFLPHYLIALVPAAAAGAAALLTRRRILGALAVAVIALPTLITGTRVASSDSADVFDQGAATIGDYIRDRSLPHQTAYVMYARVNALYYAGLRDPYPYNWTLMVTAVPGAEQKLRDLLASPGRPTWIVRADGPRAFKLDRSGVTKRLVTQHYRVLATVCGTKLLLARGAPVLPPPPGDACYVAPAARA